MCLITFVVKYVPRWFPGASFQRKAAHWRWVVTTLVDRPWKHVKDSLVCTLSLHLLQAQIKTWLQVDGTASPCVTTDLLEALPEGDKRAEQEQIAKNCAGVAYVGSCIYLYLNLFCVFTGFIGGADTVRQISTLPWIN